MKKKIYCFVDHHIGNNYSYVAIDEDAQVVTTGIASSPDWVKCDLGIHGDPGGSHGPSRLRLYQEKYPDGYELIWVDDPFTHPETLKVLQEHQKHEQ
jgi:hypothetical protein